MKKLLIIILFVPLLMRGQNPVIYGDTNPLYALDLDGSTEYAYVNSPSGLDLNSANYLTGDNTAFTSTAGNWVGLTQTSGKATFSTSATLSTSYLSTQFIEGHNYTVQLKAKSNGILGSNLLSGLGDCSTDFLSNKGTGVSYDAINGEYDCSSMSGTGTYVLTTIGPNEYVEVTIAIKNYSSGSFTYRFGGSAVTKISGNTLPYTANGTYTTIFQNVGASGYLYFFSTDNFTGSFDDIIVKKVTYSPLKIKVGTDSTSISTTATETTYAFTFTYHSGSQIELKGNGTDTYTIDDVDVSEKYDIDILAYVKPVLPIPVLYMIANNGTAYNRNGFELYISGSTISFGISGSASEIISGYSITTESKWYKIHAYTLNLMQYLYVDDVLRDSDVNSSLLASRGSSSLVIGKIVASSLRYFNGQIGWIKFTRKNGLGTIVNETKFDWKGSASTFLNDKKGTNNLTGVNITLPDVVKYKNGYK